MSRQYSSQEVAQSVVLIVEDVGSTTFVVLFLQYHQALLLLGFLLHLFLTARFGRDDLFLFRLDVFGVGHRAVNYYMLSTPFREEVYLGFSTTQPLQHPTIETTFFSGRPLFILPPSQELLTCSNCPNHTLTFLCQVFCPLQAEHCYNRVLYIFFCEKCQREFRCLKQQSREDQKIEPVKLDVRVVGEQSFEIESQGIEIKQLEKIRSKARRDVEQEVIEEQEEEDFEDESDEGEMKEMEEYKKTQKSLEEKLGEKVQGLKIVSENMQQTKKEEKDPIFQEYRKVMRDLDGPIVLYSNLPIHYNKDPINPRHQCRYCKAKMVPELQITEKMLLLSPRLVSQDWGALLIFTCSNSCKESIEECVIVQYEADAIQDSEVSVLKKRQKNKKRRKNKKKEGEKESEGDEEEGEKDEKEEKQMKQEEEENDWD